MKTMMTMSDSTLESYCEALRECLPHGSGIDSTWNIQPDAKGRIIACNSYHCMNADGMYDGWQNFTLTFFQIRKAITQKLCGPCEGKTQICNLPGDWDMRLTFQPYRTKYIPELRDYLCEICDWAVRDSKVFHQYGIRSGMSMATEAVADYLKQMGVTS